MGAGEADVDWGAFRQMMGPGHVDQLVRQAIMSCWMAMPKEKKSAGCLEAEMRRIVERALRDAREDAQAFGISEEPRRDSSAGA